MSDAKLKPCPFCGKVPDIFEDGECEVACVNGLCYINPTTGQRIDRKKAVHNWNLRSKPRNLTTNENAGGTSDA